MQIIRYEATIVLVVLRSSQSGPVKVNVEVSAPNDWLLTRSALAARDLMARQIEFGCVTGVALLLDERPWSFLPDYISVGPSTFLSSYTKRENVTIVIEL